MWHHDRPWPLSGTLPESFLLNFDLPGLQWLLCLWSDWCACQSDHLCNQLSTWFLLLFLFCDCERWTGVPSWVWLEPCLLRKVERWASLGGGQGGIIFVFCVMFQCVASNHVDFVINWFSQNFFIPDLCVIYTNTHEEEPWRPLAHPWGSMRSWGFLTRIGVYKIALWLWWALRLSFLFL